MSRPKSAAYSFSQSQVSPSETQPGNRSRPKRAILNTKVGNQGLKPDFFRTFSFNNCEGLPVEMEKFRGRVVIVTNIGCFAPNAKSELEGLNSLAHCFGENLAIIGVPTNHFYHEPTSNTAETLAVMEHVRPGFGFRPNPMSFHVTSHADVNGKNALPLYNYLKESLPLPSDDQFSFSANQQVITWSPIQRSDITGDFEKFVVRPDGKPVRRYSGKYQSVNLYHDVAALVKEFSLKPESAVISSLRFLPNSMEKQNSKGDYGNDSQVISSTAVIPSHLPSVAYYYRD